MSGIPNMKPIKDKTDPRYLAACKAFAAVGGRTIHHKQIEFANALLKAVRTSAPKPKARAK